MPITTQWTDILRALPDPKIRESALCEFRESGYRPIDWPLIVACEAMLEVLIAVEDDLELTAGSIAQRNRLACQKVRRKLEIELFP